ncbi:TPA: hypothetical protein N0F65_000905 [Lagenidium giganteum]|uniref:Secreted protein n=1 Tax=Lagenidium giganteum TaxID=4803 RepID=A0AAV2YLG5_9STRA|nr:TPA: hypothetical protein N0F65_000905 [Lagenidium giganteum]
MKQSSSASFVALHKPELLVILTSPSSVTASWSSTSCAMADVPPRRPFADTMLSRTPCAKASRNAHGGINGATSTRWRTP